MRADVPAPERVRQPPLAGEPWGIRSPGPLPRHEVSTGSHTVFVQVLMGLYGISYIPYLPVGGEK